MAFTKQRLTDCERQERRTQDRERLKAAAEQLLTSDGWQRWVRVRARNGLAKYSISNQMIIAMVAPHATFVAGFKAWLELGYSVQKGEKAIRILAPIPLRGRDTDTDTDETTDKTRVLFKTVRVFDRAQVAPLPDREPSPLEPPSQPLTGDSHQPLIEPTVAFAASLGFTVSFEAIHGTSRGWCDPKAKRIAVDATQPANAQLRILVHETIHALGIGYEQYPRAQAEVIVDTATLVVLGGLGLDISGQTVPYVAGWGEDGALEAVTQFAQLIDTLARRVDNALAQAPDPH